MSAAVAACESNGLKYWHIGQLFVLRKKPRLNTKAEPLLSSTDLMDNLDCNSWPGGYGLWWRMVHPIINYLIKCSTVKICKNVIIWKCQHYKVFYDSFKAIPTNVPACFLWPKLNFQSQMISDHQAVEITMTLACILYFYLLSIHYFTMSF